MIDTDAIRLRWEAAGARLDERGRRLFAAAEVQAAGYGALKAVAAIAGIARSAINRGEDELNAASSLPQGKIRRAGGGRKAVAANEPGLVPELKRLVEPATLDDPMRPLIWVSKSMDKLAGTLTQMGHPISADTVIKELVKLGFSRQYNRKAEEGSKHPDGNASCRRHASAMVEHITAKVVAAQAASQPVIPAGTGIPPPVDPPCTELTGRAVMTAAASSGQRSHRRWRADLSGMVHPVQLLFLV